MNLENKKTRALALGLLAAGLFVAGWLTSGVWTVLLWLGALSSLGNCVATANTRPCPHCQTGIDVADEGKLHECEHCHRHVRREGSNMIAVFGARIPSGFHWPESCCACSRPASRTISCEATKSNTLKNLGVMAAGLSVGVGLVAWGGHKKISVDVPHCDDHDSGVQLVLDPPTAFFDSEPYRDEFCRLNQSELV